MKWQLMAAGGVLAMAGLVAVAQDTPAPGTPGKAAPKRPAGPQAVQPAAPGQPAAPAAPAVPSPFKTNAEKASYGIGYNIGRDLRQAPIQLEAKLIMQGLQEALAGTDSKLSEEEFQMVMTQIQQEMATKAQADAKAAADKAAQEGVAFLEANKAKPGVTTTASGLQYQEVQAGTGASPKPTDVVRVHYTGTLPDGTKFDSSVDRGQPATFPVNGVIKGWTEALQLMKTGGKAKLVIPPHLAYGEQGAPPVIPPNATLVFDVELLEVVPQPGTATTPAPGTPKQ